MQHIRRPRLAQMMLSSQNGGAETYFEKLTLAFADAGVEQCLIIEPDARREEIFTAKKEIQVHTVRYRGIHEPFGRLQTKSILKRFRPDIILTWMNRATKRAPRGMCPVVARYGGYYKIDRCRDCDRIIANTPDIRRYLIENGITDEQVIHVPNFAEFPGVELINKGTRGTVREELGLQESDIVLLAVGRLHINKAHDILIRAMSKIPQAKLLIAGEGSLKNDLVGLAESLNLTRKIKFLGWRNDMTRLFSASDICVFPSRFEPFGNVVVEAWAQRVPIIAADSIGPKWLIEDGVNGRLFPVDDVEALEKAVAELIANRNFCDQFVENGYRKYQEQFSVNVVVQQYLNVFESFLNR